MGNEQQTSVDAYKGKEAGLESGADKETRPITDKKSGGNENTQILRHE